MSRARNQGLLLTYTNLEGGKKEVDPRTVDCINATDIAFLCLGYKYVVFYLCMYDFFRACVSFCVLFSYILYKLIVLSLILISLLCCNEIINFISRLVWDCYEDLEPMSEKCVCAL